MPNCNDPSKFSDRQVYANSVDPDQTPVPSGFTMFAILSASFWFIMSKNDPYQEWWLQFFLYSNLRKLEESRNTVRTIHLLPKFEISSLFLSSVAEQPGLCWTWSETRRPVFS